MTGDSVLEAMPKVSRRHAGKIPAGNFGDRRGMIVVFLHELLDAQKMRVVVVSPIRRKADLLIERERILATSGEKVKLVADAPQKFLGLGQRAMILLR